MRYSYKAIASDGVPQIGTVEAVNVYRAIAVLERHRLKVTRIGRAPAWYQQRRIALAAESAVWAVAGALFLITFFA